MMSDAKATSRRTLITALGLAPVGVAVAIENFTTGPAAGREGWVVGPGGVAKADLTQPRSAMEAWGDGERAAAAFENLAKEIRAKRVHVNRLKLESALEADEIADKHTLVLDFLYTGLAGQG